MGFRFSDGIHILIRENGVVWVIVCFFDLIPVGVTEGR
jgi:hypothetical protein